MFMVSMYKFELNGIVGISGELPEGATLIEEMLILTAEDGFLLERITDKERMFNVWLKGGDSAENYIEVRDEEYGGQGSDSNDLD